MLIHSTNCPAIEKWRAQETVRRAYLARFNATFRGKRKASHLVTVDGKFYAAVSTGKQEWRSTKENAKEYYKTCCTTYDKLMDVNESNSKGLMYQDGSIAPIVYNLHKITFTL